MLTSKCGCAWGTGRGAPSKACYCMSTCVELKRLAANARKAEAAYDAHVKEAIATAKVAAEK